MEKIKIINQSNGMVWFVGWLFAAGLLHMEGWRILYALVLWPYYIGEFVRAIFIG